MRVVVSSGTRTWGGLEQMAALLATGLRARGHQVTLFCRRGSPIQEKLQAEMPCEPILRGSRLDPSTLALCARALGRHRAEVVVGNTIKEPGWSGVAARGLGIPFVYRHEFNRAYHDPPRTRLLFGWVPRAHVVNSQATRRTVLESAPWLAPERVRVIPNGIDVEAYRRAPRARLELPEGAIAFGFVGRFEAQKGAVELAAAWPRVVAALPRAHLLWVGWGQLADGLRTTLADTPNVHWLGFREDVPSLMKAFDVLVAPFHQEGFGLVLVEAMASGVPVVAAHASSAPEIVRDGVEGQLVPLGDVEALAAALVALGTDPERRARMGRAGEARAQRDFTQAAMLDAHERLLLEVTEAARIRRGGAASPPALRGNPRTA